MDGYPETVGGTMIVSAGSAQRVETANRIARALNDLGMEITVQAMDEEEYRNALRYGNFDLYYGEVRLSPTYDLGIFFREGGDAAYGALPTAPPTTSARPCWKTAATPTTSTSG